MKRQYIYPQNMRTQLRLWFWNLRDMILLGIALTVSAILWAELGWIAPAAITVVFGFLSMRFDDFSILGYLKRAWKYFVSRQQYFEWEENNHG